MNGKGSKRRPSSISSDEFADRIDDIFKNLKEHFMTYVPMVVEQTSTGERAYDIYSRLLKERIVFV